MSQLENALNRIRDIESAVASGDLEAANLAAQQLTPLLVSNNIDELLSVRDRIESLTLGVKAMQSGDLDQLRGIQQQRGGAEAYQAMQQSNF
ncbi:MAG: hypothetical protein NXH95_16180 [Pseudomonadaceae bacterium]|nr:hypothetical protein [Pseudomonadaceae bacterium]